MYFPNANNILILKWGALDDLVMITSSIKKCYTHTLQYPKGAYHELYRGLDVIKSIGLKVSDESNYSRIGLGCCGKKMKRTLEIINCDLTIKR